MKFKKYLDIAIHLQPLALAAIGGLAYASSKRHMLYGSPMGNVFTGLWQWVSKSPILATVSTLVWVFGSTYIGLLIAKLWIYRAPSRQWRIGPPLNAEFLFYLFMTPQNCDAIVGDLEERFKLIHKKFGRRRANFWYWTQAVRSLGPVVWAWGKKMSLKPIIGLVAWAGAKGLIGHDGWLAAIVEMWKQVRS